MSIRNGTSRLRRRTAGAVALCASLVAMAAPAGAVLVSGPPAPDGDWCHVNMVTAGRGWSSGDSGSGYAIRAVASYGGTQSGALKWTTGGSVVTSTAVTVNTGAKTATLNTFVSGGGAWTLSAAQWGSGITTVELTLNGDWRSCGIDAQSSSGTVASAVTAAGQPADWFAGGSGPAAADSGLTWPVCSRTLSQNNGANVGNFTGSATVANATVTAYSWGWGDTTTAATTATAQHLYGSLTTMPSGGWTAVLTMTATATPGHTFVGGSTTATATCSLRVDFLNPTQAQPDGTTVDPAEDAQCPTGFGWLNPLAIVKILKCVFVPSASSVSSLGTLWGDMTTKAPFSWAYEAVGFIPSVFATIGAQASAAAGAGCHVGLIEGNTSVGNGLNYVPLPGTRAGPGGGLNVGQSLDFCPLNFGGSTSAAWAGLIFAGNVVRFTFLLALAFGVYRSVVWAIS